MSDVGEARIAALVLTYDDDLDVTLFCLDQYARHWPGCPLRFLVPVNSDAARERLIAEAPPSLDIQAIPSLRSVGATLRTLLAQAADDEWLFWANADRYPYAIPDPDRLNRVVAAVTGGEVDQQVVAVRLTRWKDALDAADAPEHAMAGESFRLGACRPHGYWHHHLMRRDWLASHVEGGPKHEVLYGYHLRVMEQLEAEPAPALIPDRSLIKFEEPILKGGLTLNYAARIERRGHAAPDRPIHPTTTAYVSPRIEKNNRFWWKAEKPPSLARNWPSQPLTVVSYGGVGSKALVRWLAPEAEGVELSRAHSHRRIPPARLGDARRLVYVFGDPREAVLSIFNRREARHARHGFEPTPSTQGRADFAVSHAANLEVDPQPMTAEWGLREFATHGVDLFRLQEHFEFWRYADAGYPVLFVRYESLGRTASALAAELGLERPPFPFAQRRSRLEALPPEARDGLDALYGEFAEDLARLSDLFEVYGTRLRPIA